MIINIVGRAVLITSKQVSLGFACLLWSEIMLIVLLVLTVLVTGECLESCIYPLACRDSLPGILSVFSLTSIVCILFSSSLWIAEGTCLGRTEHSLDASPAQRRQILAFCSLSRN